MKTKRCCTCKKTKLFGDFHKHKNRKYGLADSCKVCANKRTKEYRKTNLEKVKKVNKDWYEKNKSKVICNTNKYNQTKDDGLFYKYWSMKRRCKYPNQDCFKWYGAKGIKVEWKSYQEFKKDMYRTYKNHLRRYGHKQTTLDRVDSDKNYCKENCRWATYKQQAESIKKNRLKKLLTP